MLVKHCFPLYLEVGEGVVERGRGTHFLRSIWFCPRKLVRGMWG